MIKYTIYADKARGLYSPGHHYVLFGKWFVSDHFIILKHGRTSEEKWKLANSLGAMNLYQCHRTREIDIESYHSDYYNKERGKDAPLTDYIGTLHKVYDNFFEGEVSFNDRLSDYCD